MYTSIRRYEIDPKNVDELVRRVESGFIPIISKAPGFASYAIIDAGNGVVASMSTFQDQAGAEASNRMAADWVKESLAGILPTPPLVTAGEIRFTFPKWG